MNIDLEKKILSLRSSLSDKDMYLGPIANQEDINALTASVRSQFSVGLPRQYLDFLFKFDGLVSGGVIIYSSRRHKYPDSDGCAYDFLELNAIAREVDFMKDYLVFGESDQDDYVLDLASGKFQVRDKQAFDNVFEEFECFDRLLGFMIDLVISRS